MGWRYRKSVSILPGVRVNFGLRGASISLGGKGFRTTYSTTGRVTRSIGIPGTGLSYVTTSNNRNSTRGSNTSVPIDTRWDTASLPHERPLTEDYTHEQQGNLSRKPFEYYADAIQQIFQSADKELDWRHILVVDNDLEIENFRYFKERAEKVLSGNLDTYFEIISDTNPLDDLLAYGSEFECGTEDPRIIAINFRVNDSTVLGNAQHLDKPRYNELLQDYVCGCAIRIARDMFALLPLRTVLVDASNNGHDILSVKFERSVFVHTDFSEIDASDFVSKFDHRMEFTFETGFSPISLLEL